MRQVAYDRGKVERQILVAMIANTAVVSEIASKWTNRGKYCFRSEFSRIVGEWAVQHYREHREAIGARVRQHFEKWTQRAQPSEVQAIEKYLEALHQEFTNLKKAGKLSPSFFLTMAEEHFNMTHLRWVREELETAIDDNDLERGEEAVNQYAPLGLGRSEATVVSFDEAQIESLSHRDSDVLIRYPQALGPFFGQDLARGNFFVFLAGEKVGKTQWLIDLAVRAWTQGRRVAYFTIGDMSKNAIMRRMVTRITRMPEKACSIAIPKFFDFENGDPEEFYLERTLEEFEARDPIKAKAKLDLFMRNYGRPASQRLRIVEYPASVFTPADLAAQLQRWADRGASPDVVVLDYADLMALPSGADVRNGTHLNWMKLRGLNQEHNNLLVTATQANALSYKAPLLTASSFSEDKRKNAHPTGVVGINRTPQEKDAGIYRLNWIMRREDEFNVHQCVHVGSCLKLARPCVTSAFPKFQSSKKKSSVDNK